MPYCGCSNPRTAKLQSCVVPQVSCCFARCCLNNTSCTCTRENSCSNAVCESKENIKVTSFFFPTHVTPKGSQGLFFLSVRPCPPLVSRDEILPCPPRECPWSWDTIWCDVVLICVLQWRGRHNRNFSLLAVPLVLGHTQLRWRTNLRVPAKDVVSSLKRPEHRKKLQKC